MGARSIALPGPPVPDHRLDLESPAGPGRAHVFLSTGAPRASVVLGHGAGGGSEAADLQLLAATLPALGYRVVLIEQPWRVAGKRVAPRPPALDAAWLPMLAELTRGAGTGPVVVGGRSAGARVACRTAYATGASAVLCLSFPLHPPGQPERSRAPELRTPVAHGIPVRVIQGARDPFGTPGEVQAELPDPGWVRAVPGTHSFAAHPQDVAAAAAEFLSHLI